MSTYLSAYTISMSDTVELGREKINFLFTGDSTPFNIFSGTSENLGETSVYRNTNNFINETNNIYSSSSSFNLILNGTGNTIDTTTSTNSFGGAFNIISGIDNNVSGNGFLNIINGSGNTANNNSLSLIHGLNNLSNSSGNTFFSSESSQDNGLGQNFFLSSKNSIIIGDIPSNNFISGNNNTLKGNTLGQLNYSFIGNGENNIIETSIGLNSSNTGVINGENNIIQNRNNTILFGSNLNSISTDNYSHFENLCVNESIYGKTHKTYTVTDNTAAKTAITIDLNYSFHQININFFPSLLHDEIGIKLPIPTLNNQVHFLSLCISDNFGVTPGTKIYFVDYSSNSTFSNRLTTTPTQISAKNGSNSIIGGNRMVTHIAANSTIAYFFMWIGLINRWVMFSSDQSTTATF